MLQTSLTPILTCPPPGPGLESVVGPRHWAESGRGAGTPQCTQPRQSGQTFSNICQPNGISRDRKGVFSKKSCNFTTGTKMTHLSFIFSAFSPSGDNIPPCAVLCSLFSWAPSLHPQCSVLSTQPEAGPPAPAVSDHNRNTLRLTLL